MSFGLLETFPIRSLGNLAMKMVKIDLQWCNQRLIWPLSEALTRMDSLPDGRLRLHGRQPSQV